MTGILIFAVFIALMIAGVPIGIALMLGGTVGIGMGQVNRVDSCKLAVERANTLAEGTERARGAVAASDAFFPFEDGPQVLIDAGVTAIVQPGGSVKDADSVTACDRHGIAMLFTGVRHFRH